MEKENILLSILAKESEHALHLKRYLKYKSAKQFKPVDERHYHHYGIVRSVWIVRLKGRLW